MTEPISIMDRAAEQYRAERASRPNGSAILTVNVDSERQKDRAMAPYATTLRRGVTAADLKAMVFPAIKFVVPGYLAEGLSIFAGKPKLGKSWWCIDVCCAVASAGQAFGRVQCEGGDVLYAALEDNLRRLQSRMDRVRPLQEWPKRLTFWTDMPRLDDGGVQLTQAWIESADNPRLIVIDTMAKVRGTRSDKDTAYESDYKAMSELHRLANEKGLAVVLVHHVRKLEAEDPLDTVSGTLGLTGAADTVLVLNRTSQGVTLYGRGRDIEEIETAVTFEKDLCRWTILGQASEVHRSDERKAIITALGKGTEPLSPRDVVDLTGHSYEAVRKTLQRMAISGEVEKAGRGRYRLRVSKEICPNGPKVPNSFQYMRDD